MWRDLFNGNPVTVLGVTALMFFIGVFTGVLVWTMRRKRSPHYEHMANMPNESGPMEQEP